MLSSSTTSPHFSVNWPLHAEANDSHSQTVIIMCTAKPQSVQWEDCGDVPWRWVCGLRLSLCVIWEKPAVQQQIKRPCAQCLREWQSLLTPSKMCRVSVTCVISADPVSQAQVTDEQSKSLYCWLAHASHPSTGGARQHSGHFVLGHYCNNAWGFPQHSLWICNWFVRWNAAFCGFACLLSSNQSQCAKRFR